MVAEQRDSMEKNAANSGIDKIYCVCGLHMGSHQAHAARDVPFDQGNIYLATFA